MRVMRPVRSLLFVPGNKAAWIDKSANSQADALILDYAEITDFFAIGPEIWGAADPLVALKALIAPLG